MFSAGVPRVGPAVRLRPVGRGVSAAGILKGSHCLAQGK